MLRTSGSAQGLTLAYKRENAKHLKHMACIELIAHKLLQPFPSAEPSENRSLTLGRAIMSRKQTLQHLIHSTKRSIGDGMSIDL
jgi:hypothetical protein